jgi:hypothetical protein
LNPPDKRDFLRFELIEKPMLKVLAYICTLLKERWPNIGGKFFVF